MQKDVLAMLCDECRREDALEGEYCGECLQATKECKNCLEVKSIFEFEKNQRTPKGAVNRRAECKDCRKKSRKPLSVSKRKEFEKENPKPQIGDIFECPVCLKMFTIQTNQSINLDHDSATGEPRGYLCGSCNTGMGKLYDDISIFARAIAWLNDTKQEPDQS